MENSPAYWEESGRAATLHELGHEGDFDDTQQGLLLNNAAKSLLYQKLSVETSNQVQLRVLNKSDMGNRLKAAEVSQKELEKKLKETEKKLKELEKKQKETNKILQSVTAHLKRIDQKIAQLPKVVEDIAKGTLTTTKLTSAALSSPAPAAGEASGEASGEVSGEASGEATGEDSDEALGAAAVYVSLGAPFRTSHKRPRTGVESSEEEAEEEEEEALAKSQKRQKSV